MVFDGVFPRNIVEKSVKMRTALYFIFFLMCEDKEERKYSMENIRGLSGKELRKTRKRNRDQAYAELRSYYEENPVKELSPEEKKEARRLIREILKEG